jgi:hypothetical protein
MNVVKEIQRINLKEASLNIGSDASWHAKYKDSPYVYIGGLPYDLTEGDIIQVFSQYVIGVYGALCCTLHLYLLCLTFYCRSSCVYVM